MFEPNTEEQLRTKIIKLCVVHNLEREEWLTSYDRKELGLLLLALEDYIKVKDNEVWD